ncbi:hypothetical protein HQ545_02650 [Candidatus Woesearchaeota archaeon]|nr:hypothetical protein [Candidatus Woesearchaeota archaeon]
MVVKTITIKQDAYDILSSMKRPDESFSDLIMRVGGDRKVTAKELFGRLNDSGSELKKMRLRLKEQREKMDKEMEERYNVFA